MKKIAILAVLLLPCVPSLVAGIQSQRDADRERKIEMLEPSFERWCVANGYCYYSLSKAELDKIWGDVWAETDDFCAAVDSVDSVLNIATQINRDM